MNMPSIASPKRLHRLHRLHGLLLAGLVILASGCGNSHRAQIDLDQVLVVFEACIQEPVDPTSNVKPRDVTPATGRSRQMKVTTIDPDLQDAPMNEAFLKLFANRLNEAKLHKKTLGVRLDLAGTVIGFTDANSNLSKDANDLDLFKIEIDTGRSRVIATDLREQTVHRERPYGGYYGSYYGGGGFWMGYMLGSMRGRHDTYYRSRPNSRPNYSRMQMAPQGYAKPGNTYRSARSRGGSRSFSRGK